MKRIVALLVAAFVLPSLSLGQATVGPKIDMSYHRAYPAGPFAQVQTLNGALTTSIPILNLDGPGDTSLNFGLVHRSNVGNGGSFAMTVGRPGRGWSHTYDMDCIASDNTASEVTCFVGNNQWGEWYRETIPFGNVMKRHPSTRGDLQRLVTSGDVTAGFIVTEQATKSKWYFTKLFASGTGGAHYKVEKIVDRFGNQVDFYYETLIGNIPRLWKIEDASNARSIELEYGNTTVAGPNYSTISKVKLLVGTSIVRQWLITTGTVSGVDAFLGRIYFPHPDTGATTTGASPFLAFNYWAFDSNIAEIYDLRGNRYGYDYAQAAGNDGGGRYVQRVWRPHATTVGTLDPNPTVMAFSTVLQNNLPSERTCTISEPYGDPATPQTRQRRHVYDVYVPGQNNWFRGPIIRIHDPVDNLQNYWETFEWDYTQAMLAKYTDRRGHLWEFGNDGQHRGLIYWMKDPYLKQSGYYYQNDLLVEEILPVDTGTNKYSIVKNTYDPTTFSLLTKVADATSSSFANPPVSSPGGLAITSTYTYTTNGSVASEKLGSDNATTHSDFDAYGNARQTTLPGGGIVTRTIDDLNQVTSETMPRLDPGYPGVNRTTTFTIDFWGRRKRITFPGSVLMEKWFTYDLNGNLLSEQDENSWTTTTEYDNLNRPKKVTKPVDASPSNNLVIETFYDFQGNIQRVTNPKGEDTFYFYSSRDMLTGVRYPELTTGFSRQYAYDQNGNRTLRVDGMGRNTSYAYDDRNRLTSVTYPSPYASSDALRSITYTYYDNGSRKTMAYNLGGVVSTDTYAINTSGMPTSVFQAIPGKTVDYTYLTGSGRRNMLIVKTGVTPVVTWTHSYDTAGRPASISQSVGHATPATFEYWDDGSLENLWHGSGIRNSYGYNERGWVTSIGYWLPPRGYSYGFDYTYDKVGNVATYWFDHSAQEARYSTTYSYDRSNRLVNESRQNIFADEAGDTNTFVHTYNYDKNGNRTSVVRDGLPSSYTYLNGLSGKSNDRFSSGDGYSVSGYNNNGSPLSILISGVGTMSFTYDHEERPLQIARSWTTPNSNFKYNGDGRRVQKTTSGGTKRYVYDGDTIIAETDGSGNFTSFFLQGVGYVKMSGSNVEQHYYYQNAIGNAVTDVTAGQTWDETTTEYDAFGVERVVPVTWGSGTKNQFRFAGKHGYETEDDTPMDLLGARFYIPKLGRFLTQDPIGHAGGVNLYEYCGNNPLSRVDPSGLQFQDDDIFGTRDPFRAYNRMMGPADGRVMISLATRAVLEPLRGSGINPSWKRAMENLFGWMDGTLPSRIEYPYRSQETQDVINSRIGDTIWNAIVANNFLAGNKNMRGSIGTASAFWNSILEMANGTQFQLGAVGWQAWRKGNLISVKVWNDMTPNSFYYHMGMSSWSKDYYPSMSPVRQVFWWDYKLK
jgi:RHS repeat-associated protein